MNHSKRGDRTAFGHRLSTSLDKQISKPSTGGRCGVNIMLDVWALLAYLQGEEAAEETLELKSSQASLPSKSSHAIHGKPTTL
jgi:hypothetical protein